MPPKGERFEMRLEEELVARLDRWREEEDDRPSRAEAVRRLVELGLGTQVRFSDGEKLMLTMLADMQRHLKMDTKNADLISEAIYGGHYWALKWELQGVLHSHADKESTVKSVVDILDMWRFMESAYAKLTKEEKQKVAEETGYKSVKFVGFDGNNETEHLGVAQFLIEKMNRFTMFKGRSLNAHHPVLHGYLRMVTLFEPMRVKLGLGRELGAAEIIELLNARSA